MFHQDVDRFGIQTFLTSSSCKSDGLPWGSVICCNDMETPFLGMIGWSSVIIQTHGLYCHGASLELPFSRFIVVVKVEVTRGHLAIIDKILHPHRHGPWPNEQWSVVVSNEYRRFRSNWAEDHLSERLVMVHLTRSLMPSLPSASGKLEPITFAPMTTFGAKALVDWYLTRSCPNQRPQSLHRTLAVLPNCDSQGPEWSLQHCWTANFGRWTVVAEDPVKETPVVTIFS